MRRSARTPHGSWLVVGAAVTWNLVGLRAETLRVSYLDDSSVHEQMVRCATAALRDGSLPLTSWFPFLGLGSPQFLHYQSLPAMLTGLAGVVVGPDAAFRWTLYLLLSLWPVSVYLSARLFSTGRWAAAASAAMSPFLVSATGIGYEQGAYVWIGYGVWAQLWASITLPLAWGLSWRAIRDGRAFLAPVGLVALTLALHFETGYLALAPLLVWPLVAGAPAMKHLQRAAVVGGASLLAAAWVIVPLIQQRAWAATNEVLHGTPQANGYGAGRVLGWLGTGQVLDHGRLPVVTLFAGIGLALACARCPTDRNARALLAALVASLVLSFGPATLGGAAHLIPGADDIFFRRFMMGVQLAALLLAGLGAARFAAAIWPRLQRTMPGRGHRATALISTAAAVGAATLILAPAWMQLGAYDRRNAAAIEAQRRADSRQGAEVGELLALVAADGGGRVYAGMPSNWGRDFTVGAVPVFKYVESRDVDEVGYTLRTASLMTNPEYHFDEGNASDYRLFAIRYVILPAGYRPPVPGRLVLRAGGYCLWTTATTGYVHAGGLVGTLAADRANLGSRSVALLHSRLAQHDDYVRVAFGRQTGAAAPLPTARRDAEPARVTSENDELANGKVAATVTMRRPGVAVLSASFDSGWTATVDGHPQATIMIAPALIATSVPAGTHDVVFRYRGYPHYLLLFVVCALPLISLLGWDGTRPSCTGWQALPVLRRSASTVSGVRSVDAAPGRWIRGPSSVAAGRSRGSLLVRRHALAVSRARAVEAHRAARSKMRWAAVASRALGVAVAAAALFALTVT